MSSVLWIPLLAWLKTRLLKLRVWHALLVVLTILISLLRALLSTLVAAAEAWPAELLPSSPESILLVLLVLWWTLGSTTFVSVCHSGVARSRQFLRVACSRFLTLTIGAETAWDRWELAISLLNLRLEHLL